MGQNDDFSYEIDIELCEAATHNDMDKAESLLRLGAVPSAANGFGYPILIAASNGYIDMLKLLLSHNRDGWAYSIEISTGHTPFHCAVMNGHESVVEFLLPNVFLIDDKDNFGNTPLHYACMHGHISIALILLKRGADIHKTNFMGQTTLHLVAARGNVAMLHFVLENNAWIDINRMDCNGSTPMHLAAIGGKTQTIQILHDTGSSTQVLDNHLRTPLHLAMMNKRKNRMSVVMHLLMFPTSNIDAQDVYGNTALHFACKYGHSVAADTLLRWGVSPTKRNIHGNTPFHMACKNGHVVLMDSLIRSGGALLLQQWNKYGETAVFMPIHQNHTHMLATLLKMGARPNKQRRNKDTPLHLAAFLGREEIVRILLQYGADSTLKNNNGKSPIEIASEMKHEGVVRLMEAKVSQ